MSIISQYLVITFLIFLHTLVADVREVIYLYFGNDYPYDDTLMQLPGVPPMPGIPGMPGFPGGHPPAGRPPVGPPPGAGQLPMGPPPNVVPQMAPSWQQGSRGIRRCLYRYTYIWLNNGNSFWFYPTFVGGGSVAGFRWRGNRWEYRVMSLERIRSFQCY